MKFLYVVVLLFAGTAHAGYIELLNGDRLKGELVRIEGDHLIWKSENFGEQPIAKKKIKDLSSSVPVKINGNNAPCIIESMKDGNVMYYCGLRSRMDSVPLLSLKVLTPYEDFIQGQVLHNGRLALSGTYVRGNEVRDEWNAQAEVSVRQGDWRHSARGEYSEASWWHSDPRLKWNLRYNIDWFFRERWFWYNNLTVGAEEQRGLDSYTSLGSGTGYQFWENHVTALALKAGLAYFDEQYSGSVAEGEFDPNGNFSAGLLAADFRYSLPWGVGFFHNNELIQSFEEDNDWHLKSTTGFSAMLIRRIYSEVRLDYNIDNNPQPGKERRDKRMSVGVSYKW